MFLSICLCRLTKVDVMMWFCMWCCGAIAYILCTPFTCSLEINNSLLLQYSYYYLPRLRLRLSSNTLPSMVIRLPSEEPKFRGLISGYINNGWCTTFRADWSHTTQINVKTKNLNVLLKMFVHAAFSKFSTNHLKYECFQIKEVSIV